MNGFAGHGLNEADFGEANGLSVRSFDAFPKTKPTYLTRSRTGSAWTLLLIVASVSLLISETRRWFAGTVTHSFTVEKGISHNLQINLDVVVAMRCGDIHINVQDAAGDRILAGDMLKKDDTRWSQWDTTKKHKLGQQYGEYYGLGEEEDVHDYLGAARKKRRFAKTPSLRAGGGGEPDSCRIYGSIEGNKVQGDFHITARGHGYMEFAPHLDHDKFNFSHTINELSFGPFYPGLSNPLDNTRATTEYHFYKFQYYTSIVPTIYTTDAHHLKTITPPPEVLDGSGSGAASQDTNPLSYSSSTIWTNQYAVTEQSHVVGESQVPGIFVKYDIEPILLLVSEEWGGFFPLLIRLINVVSGVLVAGTWCWQLSDWAVEVFGRRDGRGSSMRTGFLGMGVEKHV